MQTLLLLLNIHIYAGYKSVFRECIDFVDFFGIWTIFRLKWSRFLRSTKLMVLATLSSYDIMMYNSPSFSSFHYKYGKCKVSGISLIKGLSLRVFFNQLIDSACTNVQQQQTFLSIQRGS